MLASRCRTSSRRPRAWRAVALIGNLAHTAETIGNFGSISREAHSTSASLSLILVALVSRGRPDLDRTRPSPGAATIGRGPSRPSRSARIADRDQAARHNGGGSSTPTPRTPSRTQLRSPTSSRCCAPAYRAPDLHLWQDGGDTRQDGALCGHPHSRGGFSPLHHPGSTGNPRSRHGRGPARARRHGGKECACVANRTLGTDTQIQRS